MYMEQACKKTYVSVNVDIDQNGMICPRLIHWKNGRDFAIEKMTYRCRAAAKHVSGGGIRYTVFIQGKETFLYNEGNKWFVEEKEA